MSAAVAAALVVLTAVAGRSAFHRVRSDALRRRLDGGHGGLAGTSSWLSPPPDRVAQWLDQAGVEAAPSALWWGWVALLCVGAAGGLLLGGLPVALLAGATVAAGPALALRARRREGEVRLERGMPDALEAVARSLRSGASLRLAIGEAAMVTPGLLGRELAEVARQVNHGATLVAALEAFAVRRPLAGVRLAVAALCLGVETGGAQAKAVDGVATTLRDRLGVAAEVKALSSQARMSGLVIGLAPLAFGAFAVTTDPRTGQFLFHTPVGVILLATGLSLDALGWLWMQRLAASPG